MSPPPPPAESRPPRKSRFWRWLKRGLLALLVLLVLAVVFHRQLLQWGLNWGAKYFAKREGYTLEWKLEGSMLSDIKVSELKVHGPEGGVVANIEFREAILKYDLWKLWKQGTGSFLQEISLADTTIEADIRTNPNQPKPPPQVKEKKPPPDFWVDRVNLQNISAVVHTDEGDIILRDLTLLLDKDRPGELKITELIVPSARLHLNDVQGRTAAKGRRLTLSDLRVAPDVTIPLLYADLEKLHQGTVGYELKASSGPGTLASKGRVEGLGTEPSLDGHLEISSLPHTEIARWTRLPEGFAVLIKNADLKFKGPPAKPQALDAEVVLQVAGLRVAGYGCDSAELLGTIKDGTLHMGLLKVVSGPNAVETSSAITLPPAWKDTARAPIHLEWKINAPDLSAVRESPVTLQGQVQGAGTLDLTGGKISAATAKLEASDLKLPQIELASVRADVTTDASVVKMNDVTIHVDATGRNSVRLQGQMGIADRQPTQLEVQGVFTDLDALSQALKLPPATAPPSGTVNLNLTASFDLADLKEKNPARALANGELNVDGLQWHDGRLDKARTTFAVRDGVATLQSKIDHLGRNTADLNVKMELAGRQPANVDWKINLTDLASLLPLAGLKGEPPRAGVVTSSGTASFTVADLREKNYTQTTATGALQVDGLEWREGKLDKLNADFSLRDSAVDLKAVLNHQERNTASLAAKLTLTGRQPVDARWQIRLTDLASLMPLAGVSPPPSSGTVDSSGSATFELADLKEKNFNRAAADGTLKGAAVQWKGGGIEAINAAFTVRAGIADLSEFLLRFDARNQITATGRVPLDTRQPFQAEVHGKMEQLTALSPWLAMVKAPPLTSGTAAIDWSGTGTLATGSIQGGGTVRVEKVKMQGRAEEYALALTTRHEGRQAEITELHASAGKLRLDANASISETDLSVPKLTLYSGDLKMLDGLVRVPLVLGQPPRPKVPVDVNRPLQIQLSMDRLNFTQIFQAIGQKAPVEGTVTAELHFEGRLPELKGNVAASLTGVRAEALKGRLDPADVKLHASLENHRLVLETVATQRPLQPLQIKARLPFNVEAVMNGTESVTDAPLDAEVILPPSSLNVVPHFVPALAKLEGTVGMNVKISGTVKKPSWSGTLRTDVTSIALTDVPMDMKDVKAHLDFKDARIELSDVSATVAGGRVRLGGSVDAANLKDPAFDLKLDADQALLVRDNTMSFRANADVSCKGTLAKAAVTGRIDLVRGRVFKEVEFLPLSLPNSLPPPPPSVRVGKGGPPTAPGPLKDWTFDVAISTKDPIRLLGNVLNGAVVVNARAAGTGAAPALEGKATMDGARLQLPFNRLTITRGSIIMRKENPFDPVIDIQGDSLINNHQVTVYAYGTASDPKVRLTSSPPLPENEIASLLATGSTAGDSTSAENTAANRAALLLISQTYRKLFNKAAPKRRLDAEPDKLTFSVDPLGRNNSGPAVTAIYEINPRLQATGTVGGGGFRGLLYYLVRFR